MDRVHRGAAETVVRENSAGTDAGTHSTPVGFSEMGDPEKKKAEPKGINRESLPRA